MDTLYTFWDNSTHYKTESVNFLGLMNSTTKYTVKSLGLNMRHFVKIKPSLLHEKYTEVEM